MRKILLYFVQVCESDGWINSVLFITLHVPKGLEFHKQTVVI